MKYPRFLTHESKSFNPVELAKETEKVVCTGNDRKYTNVYCVGVYGGISTGYACGCCLRCYYCWSDLSRDFPEKTGRFYSPEELFSALSNAAEKGGIKKLRLSGCEPTIGREHLIRLLELVEKTDYLFILETNGILFGGDTSYTKDLSRFGNVHVRVSLKAGEPEGFEERTGAGQEFFELPYKAIEALKRHKVSFHVAAMTDSRVMPREERSKILSKLKELDKRLRLEEEVIDPYDTTLMRLKLMNIQLGWEG